MNENLLQSLQLTVMGMGLVILSLLIIAAFIMLLGRIFRKRTEPESEGQDDALEAGPEPLALAAEVSLSDEAAAIAVAVIMQRRQKRTGGFKRRVDYADLELIGEVVNVVSVDPETGAWANAGRLNSTR